MTMDFIFFVLTGLLCIECTLQSTLVAHFDENQVKGIIRFEDNNGDINISCTFNDTFTNVQNINKIKIVKAIPKTYKQCFKNENGTLVAEYDYNSTSTSFLLKSASVNDKSSVLAHTVLLYNSSGEILACSTIVPMAHTRYYHTQIMGPNIAGKIEFLQNNDGATAVFGKIMMSDGVSNMTYDLSWYISSSSTNDDMKCNTTTLADTYSATDGDFTGCSQANMGGCKIGDLTGKHGEIKVGGMKDGNIFFIDTNLDLTKVKDLAIVLKKGSHLKACGNIQIAGPWIYRSTFHPSSHQNISGMFEFTQQSPYHLTKLKIDMEGLDNQVKSYHVHQTPIDVEMGKCSPKSVGGHWNPYGIDPKGSPAAGTGTTDEYEIGDLSGKFGFCSGKSVFKMEVEDLNLPLFQPHTILGRSVVLHADDAKGSRYTCADIIPYNAHELAVVTNFTKVKISGIEGYVIARQWKSYDGMLTPTVMVVKLWREDMSETKHHNWHVHETRHDKNENKTCMSVGPHYNPSKVDVKEKKVYSRQCTSDTYWRCELGDTSAKCGTYDIDGKKRLYIDPMTPIYGKYTISGRSFTFHGEERHASRLACADIVPQVSNMIRKLEITVKGENINDEFEARERIISYLGIGESERWTVNSVELKANVNEEGCKSVSFYLLGNTEQAITAHTEKWKKIMHTDEPIESFERCGAGSMIIPSLLLIVLGIVFRNLVI